MHKIVVEPWSRATRRHTNRPKVSNSQKTNHFSKYNKVIKCFGIRAQNSFAKNLVSLDENQYISVNEHLQVLALDGIALPNVYACGDCMTSVNKAEKFAFLIYYQSEIVIKNLDLYGNEKHKEPIKWAVYKD